MTFFGFFSTSPQVRFQDYRKPFLKSVVGFSILLAVAVLLTDGVFQELQTRRWQQEQDFPVAAKEVVEERMLYLLEDVRYLREGLGQLLEAGISLNSARTTTEFVRFAEARRVYDQIRILNLKGVEQIRVNYRGGRAREVPLGELQDKSGRDYVQIGRSLQDGEVYLSTFDLNMEQGKIEHPLKPILRLVTPLHDEDGVPQGLLVMNYLAGRLLENLAHLRQNSETQELFLNSRGYFYVGYQASEEWGFLRAGHKGARLEVRAPLTWAAIAGGRERCSRNAEGLFCFVKMPRIARALLKEDDVQVQREEEHPWIFVSFLPAEVLFWQNLEPRLYLLAGSVVLWFLLFSLSWRLSRQAAFRALEAQRLSDIVQHQSRLSSLGEVTTAMAHEINTPLAHIYLTFDQVARELNRPELRKERLERALASAQESCRQISQLIESIRTFGRSGQSEAIVPFPLRSSLDSALRLLEARRHQLQARINVEWPEPLPPVQGVPAKMEQVFVNLLTNALDSLQGQKDRQIRIWVQAPPQTAVAGQLEVWIQDTGPGVAQDLQQQIFEPFFTTKPLGEGTGLGLSVTYGLLAEQQGSIRYEAVASGATFVVSLPLSPEGEAS